jgi:esterase/lipase superfamily enzyme
LATKQSRIPKISTRGFYDLTNGRKIKNLSYTIYPKSSLQKLCGTKELVIIIHGLRNDITSAQQKFLIVKKKLKQLGYHYHVLGFSYDSNTKGAHLKKSALKALLVGQKIAKQNGNNLSKFIIDFKKTSPKTKIRLLGHSLGTEVIISTIQKLSHNTGNQNIIESVHFFGSSVSSEQIRSRNMKNSFKKIVRSVVKNYFSLSDEVLKESHEVGWIKNPIGYIGITNKPFSKFKQICVNPKNHRFASYTDVLKSFP